MTNSLRTNLSYESKCIEHSHLTYDPLKYKCDCGAPLETSYSVRFEREKVRSHELTLWRYKEFFPYVSNEQIVSLGEGWTPLVNYNDKLFFKLDFLNPTGSFKDRGSSMLISAIHFLVKKMGGFISEDSSGNAGASMAAYSARAGIRIKVFVPSSAAGQKFNQILFYGAKAEKVEGDRSNVAFKAQSYEKGKFYVGHIWHPIFRDGIKTLAYEIAEQLSWSSPDFVYLPVSSGTLLIGLVDGFKTLVESDVVEVYPKIVACQTKQVSPLYHRLKNIPYDPPKRITSIADALVNTNPPLLNLMERKIREVKGDVEVADENQIYSSFVELARNGFFVEPSSAVAFAVYKSHLEKGVVSKGDRVVVILTGSGLKTSLIPT